MRQQPEIYFHVGLPKTASTFLQRNVFPRLQGIEFVKKHAFRTYRNRIHKTPYSKILLSTELNIGKSRTDEKIRRFAASCPDTRPIILLRRHDRWIASKYKQHIRKHGWLDFDDFFNLHDTGKVKVHELRYRDKIRFLNELFNQPALVFFQEELLSAPFATIDWICSYLGVSCRREDIDTNRVKRAYSTRQLKAMRRFNRKIRFRDPAQERPEVIRQTTKKFYAFLLHSVAYLSYLWPERWIRQEGELIPEGKPEEIRQHYEDDWQRCIEYVQSQRNASPEAKL